MITNMRYHAIVKKDKKKFIDSQPQNSWHSHTRHFPQLYSSFPSSKFTYHRISISFIEIYPVGFGFAIRKSVFNLSSAFISDFNCFGGLLPSTMLILDQSPPHSTSPLSWI